MQGAGPDGVGDEWLQSGLDDGGAPAADKVDLSLVRIDADDLMAVAGKAAANDGALVAETENTDSHGAVFDNAEIARLQ